MKVSAALLKEIIKSLINEEIKKVKGGYKVYPKKPQKGRKTKKALSKNPMSYEKALKQLRAVERSKSLGENKLTFGSMTPHDDVVKMIDHTIGDSRLSVDIKFRNNFKKLLEEISIVESGYQDDNRKIYHDNEMNGEIKGIFQISPDALTDLRRKEVVPKSKKRLVDNGALKNDWETQSDSDIYANKKLQTVAACLYCLHLYYNLYKEGDLSSLSSRAKFWEKYYNTKLDEKGTAEYYVQKLKKFKYIK